MFVATKQLSRAEYDEKSLRLETVEETKIEGIRDAQEVAQQIAHELIAASIEFDLRVTPFGGYTFTYKRSSRNTFNVIVARISNILAGRRVK